MNKSVRIRSFEDLFKAIDETTYMDIVTGNNGVHSKKSLGSTSPRLVKKAIAAEEKWLKSFHLDLK